MSSQQRVQAYMERHRISALFEDMMARLAKHLPNDPVPFLLKLLQRFDEKTHKVDMSASMPALRKTASVDGSGMKAGKAITSWAPSYTPAFGEDRGYERPWVNNMKKVRSMEQEQEVRKSKKLDSSGKKVTPTSDTDMEQLFGKEQLRKGKSVSFKSGAKQWATSEDEDSPQAQRRSGTILAEEREAKLLREEMSASNLQRKYSRADRSPKSVPSGSELRELRQKPGERAKKHKRQLAEMAAAQQRVETLGFLDSGEAATDPDQGGYEEATDLLEDASDLAFEGVTNAKSSGQKVSKSMRRRRPPPPEPEVKVAICSKCARLVGSDDRSTNGGDGYGKYVTLDSSSEVTAGEYGGTFTAPITSDDDFESASQVVGPRHPVWVDSDEGASPARPSSTTLRTSMIHDSSAELFASGARRDSGDNNATYRAGSTLVGQAWESRTYRSQTEVSSREVIHSDSLRDQGRSWQRPSSDDDSGF